MLRQASSRNQRAKGFRLKHALQIGILVAICIWLLYQVKHSHEKKIAYDAKNSKLIIKVTENQEDFFKFGRKELRNEAGTINEIQKEEETEEAQGEPEVKQEEPEDEEVRGAGDDGIDDQDQETTEKDERREGSDDVYDKDVQIEEKVLFDNLYHEEGTQAAREENYYRDDASSAVVHEAHTTESETVNGDAKSTNEEHIVEHSKVDGAGENLEKKETGAEDVSSKVDGSTGDSVSDLLVKDNGTKTDDSRLKNGTTAETKESDAETSKADNGLMSDSRTVEAGNQIELLTKNSTIASTESNIELELPTNSTSVSWNQTEGQHNSTLIELDGPVEMSNSTVSLDSVRDGNATDEKGTSTEIESNVVDPAGKSDSIATLDLKEHENATTSTENGDATTSSSTDLSTLPDIQTEAKAVDQEAAE